VFEWVVVTGSGTRREVEPAWWIESARLAADLARTTAMAGDTEDYLLRLMFAACHPVLPTEARVALTLRLLGRLSTREITRAFGVPKPTVRRRIARAHRALAEAEAGFDLPVGAGRAARLASVLDVIYLVFNHGYSATVGDDRTRPGLCAEALRLGRLLAGLAPGEPEVHGLVALMEIQAARSAARSGPAGEPVLLPDQDRSRWDWLLIRRGLAALGRAEALGGTSGPFVLHAAIAACHARARTAGETDWPRIVTLYEALSTLTPSPVIELNRAVALGMAYGPPAGLALLDALAADPALQESHLLPSLRGDLLARIGRLDEARAEFQRAASLSPGSAERTLLLDRARACAGPGGR
jgi:predicted RNA polymerase sigma factor